MREDAELIWIKFKRQLPVDEDALEAACMRIADLERQNAQLKGEDKTTLVGFKFHQGVIANYKARIAQLEAQRAKLLAAAKLAVGDEELEGIWSPIHSRRHKAMDALIEAIAEVKDD